VDSRLQGNELQEATSCRGTKSLYKKYPKGARFFAVISSNSLNFFKVATFALNRQKMAN